MTDEEQKIFNIAVSLAHLHDATQSLEKGDPGFKSAVVVVSEALTELAEAVGDYEGTNN